MLTSCYSYIPTTTQFVIQSHERIRSSYVSYSPDHSKPDLIVITAVNGSSCELVPTEMV